MKKQRQAKLKLWSYRHPPTSKYRHGDIQIDWSCRDHHFVVELPESNKEQSHQISALLHIQGDDLPGLVLIQEGAAIRPVVTFTPDYKKIFTSEQITMTCDVASTIAEGMYYIWYKDSKQVYNGKSYIIQNATISHGGSYQCQTRPGEVSDPARLDVSHDWVILQTPLYVYEGDEIYIRCHHYPGYPGGRTRFYKDKRNITDWSDNGEYYIRVVDRTTAGTYGCRKEVYHYGFSYQHEDEVSVSVEDLLSQPKITLIKNLTIKGDPMSLTCNTTLSPFVKPTELQFAFYKDGWTVQRFSSSDKYEIQSAQVEDSGNYICEVKTSTNSSTRRSYELAIQIQEACRSLFPEEKSKVAFAHWKSIGLDHLIKEMVQGGVGYAYFAV
ncbi:Fc receptor-like protein 3 [Leptodactylus fuscus]|uniref:Fc receptor-like protein 3 n=1 Tax=Leptodactylus fuscus TaxID=238119 RepID=UPI003F4F26F1